MAGRKKSFWYRNSLSLVFLFLFLASVGAQAYTGWIVHNKELVKHHVSAITFLKYLTSGAFIEATFENWESEFLQMALFVVLTVFLRQKGSSESKKPDDPLFDLSEEKPRGDSPWPVRKGGIFLVLYENSLSIALTLLFAGSFLGHWYGSWREDSEQQILEGGHVQPFSSYLLSARFWFESFQNWQSEFLSVLAIVFLSIYLRQAGSAQSKPVNAPDEKTGD